MITTMSRKQIQEMKDMLRGLLDNASSTYLLYLLMYMKRQADTSEIDYPADETLLNVVKASRLLFEQGGVTPCSQRLLAAITGMKNAFLELSDIIEILEIDVSKWTNSVQETTLRNVLNETAKIFASRNDHDQLLINLFDLLSRIYTEEDRKSGAALIAPKALTDLLVRLLRPKSDDAIYDPACGTGSLLMCCADHIAESSEYPSSELYGQEVNVASARIARLNLLLSSSLKAYVETGNPLREPAFKESRNKLKTFDVVLSNPPFSMHWDVESAAYDQFDRFRRGIPPRARADYAYILHMIQSLKQNVGRMGTVVSRGVLFRGGVEGEIRRKLIEEGLLDAVISLPPKLFLNTSIPVAVLIFKNDRRVDDGIIFIDVENDFEPGKLRNILPKSAVSKILKTYAQKKNIDFYSSVVSYSDIAKNDFDLSINRYVDRETVETDIDIAVIRKQRQSLQVYLKRIESELDRALRNSANHIAGEV